jgi:hypothetical protein
MQIEQRSGLIASQIKAAERALCLAATAANADVLASNARDSSVHYIHVKRWAPDMRAASARDVIAPVKATAAISSSSVVIFIIMAQRRSGR